MKADLPETEVRKQWNKIFKMLKRKKKKVSTQNFICRKISLKKLRADFHFLVHVQFWRSPFWPNGIKS